MAYEPTEVERRWQRRWAEAKAFEPEPQEGRPKFFCTFPYPYVNGLPHVGHLFTMMRVEAYARYKRARGYTVLFPQAWHCTGQPLVNAALRVKEGDQKQLQILRDFGVPEEELPRFAEPVHWIDYFVPGYKADVQSLGMSVDWRREFITTSLNPRYDAFIRWQFRKLKERGYVAKGKHPVVWCPKRRAPVSDHGRLSGEGETPQEFTLVLFPLADGGATLACATLRPETLPGLTNLWVDPELTYVRAEVDGDLWIVSEPCAHKLAQQGRSVAVRGAVRGAELVGKTVTWDGRDIPVLPASFPTAEKGSGIVMSVPSDAPDDYVALRDLQRDRAQQERYGLRDIGAVRPIPIIDTPDLGALAAVTAVEDAGIEHQGERAKLDEAKKLVYKKGFYEGTMTAGPYAGARVEQAKENVKRDLLLTGQAIAFYELTGPVVCRCLTPCVVSIVSDQWFLLYGDPEWKRLAHRALDRIRLFPEQSRPQFTYVIDWLREWACTREEGLGTRLPWDERWLIESLSDSTLYNAYYTIAHRITDLPEEEVDDAFFDYVFLGKGQAKQGWNALRKEFLYWYPVDFRNSGKDLIQNHLAFMLFTHVAIWPDNPEYWPVGYGVNGWVTVDGRKMSKSLGNLIPVRAMVHEYGADACRLTILNGGEGMDDPNWDTELARTTKQRLEQFLELVTLHGTGRERTQPLDEWFASALHSAVRDATAAMERTDFRTAIQHSWFGLTNTVKEYLKLTGGEPHRALFAEAIETQIRLLQPFTPHAAEEAWHAIGKQGLVSLAPWPAADETRIRPELERTQALIDGLGKDITNVQQLLKLDRVQAVTVVVSPAWKYEALAALREHLEQTRSPGELLKRLLPRFKAHGQELAKLVPAVLKDPAKLAGADLTQDVELTSIGAAARYLEQRFACTVSVERAEESAQPKAKQAFPGKPAIVLA